MVIAGILAVAAVAIGVAWALALTRRSAHRSHDLGSVSQRWLSAHRTEI